MKRIIIVYQWMVGTGGDWRPWLKTELQKSGCEVIIPEMPDIDTPVILLGLSRCLIGLPMLDEFRTLNWVVIQKEMEASGILGLFQNQVLSELTI